MKRMLKLILVLVSIAVLGCSSSKDVVNIPGGTVPDNRVSVKFMVDKASFTDMDSNSYIYLEVKEDIAGSKSQQVVETQRYPLNRASVYVLSGYYVNTTNMVVPFSNDSFNTDPFGQEMKSMTIIRHSSRLIPKID